MGNSEALVEALAQTWSSLPALVGEDWEEFEAAVLVRLRALEQASPAQVAAAEDALLALLEPYPAARRAVLAAFSVKVGHTHRGAVRAAPRIAGSTKHARYLEVPVFFATDRAPAPVRNTDPYFSGDRGDEESPRLEFGVVRVAVPDDARKRNLRKPRWWKLQFRQDPSSFVVVLGADALDREGFVRRAQETLAGAVRREALVFIHGYNVSFADAARRAAQMAYDLDFEGLPMLYSWTSDGTALRYTADERSAEWTVPRFKEFLTLALTELGAERVHAVAHSMGNRVLASGLETFDLEALPEGAAQFQEVVFAAPDVDAGVFRDAAKELSRRARRCTLYASAKDKALLASQKWGKYRRAGQAGDGILVVAGIDTIDATELDTDFMSHSYVGDHSSILSDLYYMIRGNGPDDRFGLAPAKHANGRYWIFDPTRR